MMRVAAWQCRPGPLDGAGNLRRLAALCPSAAARQVEVLVTPEMFISGYAITRDEVLRLAEDAGGPTEAAVATIARRHRLAIVYGHPERAAGGTGAALPRPPSRRSRDATASRSSTGTPSAPRAAARITRRRWSDRTA